MVRNISLFWWGKEQRIGHYYEIICKTLTDNGYRHRKLFVKHLYIVEK